MRFRDTGCYSDATSPSSLPTPRCSSTCEPALSTNRPPHHCCSSSADPHCRGPHPSVSLWPPHASKSVSPSRWCSSVPPRLTSQPTSRCRPGHHRQCAVGTVPCSRWAPRPILASPLSLAGLEGSGRVAHVHSAPSQFFPIDFIWINSNEFQTFQIS
jgi:hypothetical protein